MSVNANPCALIAVERRRCRPPLADRGPAGERRVARAEPIGRAPGEHGLRDLGSPGDAALDARRARAVVRSPSLASSLSAASDAA